MANNLFKTNNKMLKPLKTAGLIFLLGILLFTTMPLTVHAAGKNGGGVTINAHSMGFGGNNQTQIDLINGYSPTTADHYFDGVTDSEGKPISKTVQLIAGYTANIEGTILYLMAKLGDAASDTILLRGFSAPMGTVFTQARSIVKNSVIPPMQTIGFAVVILFFFISLLEHSISQQMTLESFLKMFAKLIVGVAAVEYSPQLFDLIFRLGEALANFIQSLHIVTGGSASIDIQAIAIQKAKSMADAGGLSWLITLANGGVLELILLLFAIILLICSFVVSLMRVFEVLVRGAFLPIGLAFLAEHGWSGAGGRYLKKYLACCSQCMVLVFMAQILTLLMVSLLRTGMANQINQGMWAWIGIPTFEAMIIMLALGVAGVGVMFKSQSVVNDIFGV